MRESRILTAGERSAGEIDAAALLIAAQGGDRQATELLFVWMRKQALIAARRALGPHAIMSADDIAHDALLRAFQHLSGCRAQNNQAVFGWLRTITVRVVIESRRANAEKVAHAAIGIGEPGACLAWDVDEQLSEESPQPRHDVVAVRHAFAELPPETRAVVFLRAVCAAPFGEIAERLGISESGAKRRFQRAQARMRREVRRSCG
jgi:RNA polymerase sigma factor (sigma-70 family)